MYFVYSFVVYLSELASSPMIKQSLITYPLSVEVYQETQTMTQDFGARSRMPAKMGPSSSKRTG